MALLGGTTISIGGGTCDLFIILFLELTVSSFGHPWSHVISPQNAPIDLSLVFKSQLRYPRLSHQTDLND